MFVRIDSRSSVELTPDSQGQAAFQIYSGGLYIHTPGTSVGVISPGGTVDIRDPGIYRVDAEAGETRLSVIAGRASLDAGSGALQVAAGQRAYARRGGPAEGPQPLGRMDDVFAQWDQDREGRVGQLAEAPNAQGSESRRYVPESVAPYASELDENGSWSYSNDVGSYVWRPYVGADWSPYSNGNWDYTGYGWTWAPYEAWGWAPFHYGRWGFGVGLGWYWIPGATWGPGWVSWSFGGGLVGWSPLGFRDHVFGFGAGPGFGFRGGFGVPRGGVVGSAIPRHFGGWNYARVSDLRSHNLSQLRQSPSASQIQGMSLASTPRQQPTRDFSSFRAAPNATAIARTGPTIGDSVPELRRNWKMAPVNPVPPLGTPGGALASRGNLATTGAESRATETRPSTAPHTTLHPTDTRGGARPGVDFPVNGGAQTGTHPTDRRDSFSERSTGHTNVPRNQTGSGGREVLRPFFESFSSSRNTHPPSSQGGGSASGTHGGGSSHATSGGSSGHSSGGSHSSGGTHSGSPHHGKR